MNSRRLIISSLLAFLVAGIASSRSLVAQQFTSSPTIQTKTQLVGTSTFDYSGFFYNIGDYVYCDFGIDALNNANTIKDVWCRIRVLDGYDSTELDYDNETLALASGGGTGRLSTSVYWQIDSSRLYHGVLFEMSWGYGILAGQNTVSQTTTYMSSGY